MKISFLKVTPQNFDFMISDSELKFSGILKKIDIKSVKCIGKIEGNTPHNCDRCGVDINLVLNEPVELILSDGIYKDIDNKLCDVVEFFDGSIDLDEVFKSEVEAFKSDYFYCKNCKNL
ncbi:hypothetical protein KDE13_01605 [Campylobacter sp. faydin G-140]|uniref:hypothetical protein n=1 Tax=Campylobacter anatolicus TaxID=2829105 RepID=UPI001B93EC5E|nr:hypothetical protein [Campylobacter anatolicus]MBR8465059.1 hypothetical protein [Campylobacter anatolicus]